MRVQWRQRKALSSGLQNRTTDNGHKWKHRRIPLNIRNQFFTDWVTEQCNRLPRGAVKSHSLEIFNNSLDMVLENLEYYKVESEGTLGITTEKFTHFTVNTLVKSIHWAAVTCDTMSSWYSALKAWFGRKWFKIYLDTSGWSQVFSPLSIRYCWFPYHCSKKSVNKIKYIDTWT